MVIFDFFLNFNIVINKNAYHYIINLSNFCNFFFSLFFNIIYFRFIIIICQAYIRFIFIFVNFMISIIIFI